MPTKSWYQSKTVWFNILSSVVTIATAAQGSLPETALPYVIAFIGIINVVLRVFFTNMPVA
jgi:hypothetical protein